MTDDQLPAFNARLRVLAEVFDVTLSPGRQAIYFEALSDLPFDAVAGAITAAVKGCKFFPKPVEIRTLAEGDPEDAIEAAWQALRTAMGRLGYMASVSVRDGALAEAVLACFGSWAGACGADLSPEMWASKRKEFGRVYRLARSQAPGGRYLVGYAEQQNAGLDGWAFTPVGCIEASGVVRSLTAAEAEAERERLAIEAHEVTRDGARHLLTALRARLEDRP